MYYVLCVSVLSVLCVLFVCTAVYVCFSSFLPSPSFALIMTPPHALSSSLPNDPHIPHIPLILLILSLTFAVGLPHINLLTGQLAGQKEGAPSEIRSLDIQSFRVQLKNATQHVSKIKPLRTLKGNAAEVRERRREGRRREGRREGI